MNKTIKQTRPAELVSAFTNKIRGFRNKFGMMFCIALVFAMFFTADVLKAQDTTIIIRPQDTIYVIKPNSRAGGTIGLQIPTNELYWGVGLEVFFHQTLTPSWFLSIDAAYHRNSFTIYNAGVKGEAVMTSIPFSLGINAFLTKSGVCPYLGLGVGILNQKGDGSVYEDGDRYTAAMSSGTYFMVVPTVGVSFPIANRINLAANIKYRISEEFSTGINFGLAYLIP
ncbi:MAG: outer membrane beta-barrel protein [Bacteroidetes bacterium]|nr:outer membrane beta-barrel protein [Bacteroidota bacterium]